MSSRSAGRALTAGLLLGATAVAAQPGRAPGAPAAPPPAPGLTFDLDGDGAAETLTAAPSGLRVRGARGAVELPHQGAPRPGTLRAATVSGERLVAWELAAPGQPRRLWVGRVSLSGPLALSELAVLALGPMGVDAEYSAGAELSAAGLVRWQERPDLVRCDGARLRVLAQRWDVKSRRWQATATSAEEGPSLVAASAREATVALAPSKADAPPAAPADVFRARYATSQRGARRADELAIPSELDDGDPGTAWRTGDDSDGTGEVLGFRARLDAARVLRLRVRPGDVSSAAARRTWGRPARIWLVGEKQRYLAVLPDPVASGAPLGAEYVITLPQPVEQCLSVVIEAVHPGSARGLAISELVAETELDEDHGGTGALVESVARGGQEGDRAAVILAARGAAAASAISAALTPTRELAQRRRLVRALSKLTVKEAAPPLTAALREGWMGEPDLEDAVEALARLGQEHALGEVVASAQASPAARLRAVAALTRARSSVMTTVAGVGDRELRQAVITGLATLPTQTILAAAKSAPTAAAQGDLWRAAVRSVTSGSAEPSTAARAQLAELLEPALSTATTYELRYRLSTALAELAARTDDRARLARLLTHLASRAELGGPERTALRQAVAELAARHASAGLVAELTSLLRDPDAGVRLALARGVQRAELSEASEVGASGAAGAGGAAGAAGAAGAGGAVRGAAPWPAEATARLDEGLGEMLATDAWPELRRAAATALGQRCRRSGPAAALARSVDHDAAVEVRQDALVALVTCRAPKIAERLMQLWASSAPPELRLRAVSLSVMLGDPRLAPALARSLARWRSEAFSDEAALRLAARAAESLGHLGGASAAPALRAALADGAYPEIVAAAAAGLGTLGPACPADARAELQRLTRSDERAVALAARRAVSRCGAAPRPKQPGADVP